MEFRVGVALTLLGLALQACQTGQLRGPSSAEPETTGADSVQAAHLRARPASFVGPLAIEEREAEYFVEGLTAAALRQAMTSGGPNVPGTGETVAATSSSLTASGLCTQFREGFAFQEGTVRLNLVLTYPNWTNRAAAPKALQARWVKFSAALRVHERGHRKIAITAAERLKARLAALKPATSCAEVERAMAAEVKTAEEKLDAEQVQYDKITDHGRKRGTVL